MWEAYKNGVDKIKYDPGKIQLSGYVPVSKVYEAFGLPQHNGRVQTYHKKELIKFMDGLKSKKPIRFALENTGTFSFRLVEYFDELKSEGPEKVFYITVSPLLSLICEFSGLKLPRSVPEIIRKKIVSLGLSSQRYLKPCLNFYIFLASNIHSNIVADSEGKYLPMKKNRQDLRKALGIESIEARNAKIWGAKKGKRKTDVLTRNILKIAKELGWIHSTQTRDSENSLFFKVNPEIISQYRSGGRVMENGGRVMENGGRVMEKNQEKA